MQGVAVDWGGGGEKGMEVGIEGGEVSDEVLWINQQAV